MVTGHEVGVIDCGRGMYGHLHRLKSGGGRGQANPKARSAGDPMTRR